MMKLNRSKCITLIKLKKRIQVSTMMESEVSALNSKFNDHPLPKLGFEELL
jgi:hypothetical protein